MTEAAIRNHEELAFSLLFKKEAGISPKEFQNQILN